MLLQSLPSVNLKEIASYLRSEDKCNLLLICKEFHQIFLPMVMESIFFSNYDNYYGNKKLRYNKYVKHIVIHNYYNLNFHINNYPNLVKLTISTIVYIKRFSQLSHLELVGLTFSKGELKEITNNSLCSIEKGTSFDINLKLFYSKLGSMNYLNVAKPCKKFFNLLLPYISNKVQCLKLHSDSKSPPLHSTILSKMYCVIKLKLTINSANFKDIKYIETAQLNHLKYLKIDHLCSYKIGILKISFNHMPSLQELVLSKMSSVRFDGISNLKYLELNKTKLKDHAIDSEQFPKLFSILVNHYSCMPFRLLYSIFNLPNLTCLTLLSDSITLPDYLLLDEIYPNKPSNLIKISIN